MQKPITNLGRKNYNTIYEIKQTRETIKKEPDLLLIFYHNIDK